MPVTEGADIYTYNGTSTVMVEFVDWNLLSLTLLTQKWTCKLCLIWCALRINFCTFGMLETDNCSRKAIFRSCLLFLSVTLYWKHKLSTCSNVIYILLTLNVILHLVLEDSVLSYEKPTLSLPNEHTPKFNHPPLFPYCFKSSKQMTDMSTFRESHVRKPWMLKSTPVWVNAET